MHLAHVTLNVADVERSKAFYLQLGFRLIVNALPDYCRVQVGDSLSTISLHRHEGPIAAAAEIGIVFDTAAELDAFVAGLVAKGLAASPPADKTWLWRESRLVDPDGHTLLLMYPGTNHLDPPWRVR